jgi:hypothetical protein
LFWERSLFFWGFIAAAFLAYSEVAKEARPDLDLMLTIAAFGLVCSVAWTLANRGSKYWQEAWEAKLKKYEMEVLGIPLFSEREPLLKNTWWGAREYSVSRLTIALSDFTVGLWILLGIKALPYIAWGPCLPILIPTATGLYVLAMFIGGRSRKS